MKDKQNLENHWKHTSNLYSQLTDYFRFMVYDGNIEQPTFEMMQRTLDDLFDQYREIYNLIMTDEGEE